jgi:hypothetical protein
MSCANPDTPPCTTTVVIESLLPRGSHDAAMIADEAVEMQAESVRPSGHAVKTRLSLAG